MFEKSIDKVIAGHERSTKPDPKQEAQVAYHEVGHAIVGWFLKGGDPLLKLTIRARSKGALGFAQYLPKEIGIKSKQDLLDDIACLMAGRAAEEIFCGVVASGAHDDFSKAQKKAMDIVSTYGMSENQGNIRLMYDSWGRRRFSEKVQRKLDIEVGAILKEQHQVATKLLEEKKDLAEALFQVLIKKKTITFGDIYDILGDRPFPPPLGFKRLLLIKKIFFKIYYK